MRKTMSSKQIAANRQNARKSTGPKTARGRAASKMNALKHGILSDQVIVRGRNIKESSRDYIALHQRFRDDLNPVGVLEELLVDQIVTTHWRLRRALRAESGEIALSVDEGEWKRVQLPHPQLQWAQWTLMGDPIPTMHESVLGNQVIEGLLGKVRNSVEQEGELTEAAIQKFIQAFGGEPNTLTQELEEFRVKLQENTEGLEGAALLEKNKNRALAFLDRKLSSFSWWKKKCEEREEKAEEARQAAAVLPSMETLEKILRYETKLERHMNRAMALLERLQRMRQGEAVPAPMSVVVAERA